MKHTSRKKAVLMLSVLSVLGLWSTFEAPAAAQTGTLCTGTPAADVPVDVTSQMSMVAPAVTVYQLTGLDKNGQPILNNNKVVTNYLTNVDVVNYTALTPPSFIVNMDGIKIKTIRADHQGAQVASTLFGLHVRVSQDGTLVAQAGNHKSQLGDKTTGDDIFVTNLANNGPCTSNWITNQHFTPAVSAGPTGVPLTNPSWDSSKGLYLIAYAPGGSTASLPPNVYTAYSDGVTLSPYVPMEPIDSCTGQLYHKTRMDYQWPYLVFLQRQKQLPGNTACGDIMDLRTGATIEFGDGTAGTTRATDQIFYNHDNQWPNGRSFFMEASTRTGGMAMTTLLDQNGNFIPGSNNIQTAQNPAGYIIININPAKVNGVQAEWCDLQPDGKALCTPGPPNSTGGVPGVPVGCYPAYTIDLVTFAVRFLTCTDGGKTGSYEGHAVVRSSYVDPMGLYHALFRSDRTGQPQVYELVYAP